MSESKSSVYAVENLSEMIEFAKDGIVSKTITEQQKVKVVLFCMSAGQSLSEHTASVPATIHVIRGEGSIILDKKEYGAVPGTWIYMQKNQLHGLIAKKDMVFLLHMLK